jgi:NADPH-ferrihemoprotein reductase
LLVSGIPLTFPQNLTEPLGSKFELVTAFSRAQAQKVYVQHRLKEKAKEVNDLLQNSKANFYVCGDAANMAREVSNVLVQIISEQRGIPLNKAEDVVKNMRSSGVYQEDVWS